MSWGEARLFNLVGSSVRDQKKFGVVNLFLNFCSVKEGCLNQSKFLKTYISSLKVKETSTKEMTPEET